MASPTRNFETHNFETLALRAAHAAAENATNRTNARHIEWLGVCTGVSGPAGGPRHAPRVGPMLSILRLTTHLIELVLGSVLRLGRFVFFSVAFNPKLGPLRHLVTAAAAFLIFAVGLVYVVAPIRGVVGHYYMGERLRYDAERWLATAIYDRQGQFIGTFDPRLDSQRDVNWTETAIELGGHTANPDHKSIPVTEVPTAYWQCLTFHEDRYIGGLLNPYGIDLLGVLKIPYSTHQALDCAQTAEPRRRRLNAAHAVCSRDLQDAAKLARGWLHQIAA